MPTAQEKADALSTSITDRPAGEEDGAAAISAPLSDLHNKAEAICALIDTGNAGDIVSAGSFALVRGLISGEPATPS